MNVTQSLSNLYSQFSSQSSNTNASQVFNSLASATHHMDQERNIASGSHHLSLEQKMLLQLNMYSYQYPSQIGPSCSYNGNSAENYVGDMSQSVRRPITGCKNFSMKSKYNPLMSSSSSTISKSTSFPFKHVNSTDFLPEESISSSSSFVPAFLSPVLKYSRKVFVGGLPPDIDESKN